MKKRWISLLLCLVMVLSVALTGCNGTTDEEAQQNASEEASQSALTLTMWVVSESEVTSDAYSRISAAVNSITKSKFKIQLVLKYFTEDQYRTQLETAIENFKGVAGGTEESAPDEYETNDAGLSVIKYPEVLANQVDIIYIAGQDMYFDFIDKGWLATLDAELSSSAKIIKEYVSATLLSAAMYNGSTYAIPNNRPVGEYTYMLLNKELMKKYGADAYVKTNRIDGLFNENLYPFLNLVNMMEGDSVIPIDASYEECLNFLAYYWNVSSEDYSISDLQKFSLFGYRYQNLEELSRGSVILGYNSLFTDPEFTEDYLKLNEFRFNQYLREDNDARTKALVKFVKGDSTMQTKKDSEGVVCYTDENGVEYYPIVVGYPTASADDIYGNMFGVYTASRNVSRAMDIVAYLNTNADFRNLLQYGVEGVDYKVTRDEKGNFLALERLGTGYNMNVWATGNTFIAYPDTEAGLDINVWENGKVQNRESLVSPMLGFNFADFASKTGPEAEEETIDSKNRFNMSFTTGHSKDIISQNETLKDWLARCDAAGKGHYVLSTKTVTEDGDRYNYYVYSNNLTSPVQVSVVGEPIREADEKGKESVVAADFILNYTPVEMQAITPGYQITCISVYAKTGLACNVSVNMNEEGVAIKYEEMGEQIVVDFMNTANYSIEVFGPLHKTDLEKCTDLNAWVSKIPSQTGVVKTHLLTYQTEDEFICGVYRTKLSEHSSLRIEPMGDSKNLILNMSFTESAELEMESYYVLYYIRVKLHSSDVKVSCRQTINGVAKEIDGTKKIDELYVDLDILGQLDTGLVKFSENLNAKLIAQLDACYAQGMEAIRAAKTPEEKVAAIDNAMSSYSALVAEIGKLLDPSYEFYKAPAFNVTNYPILAENLKIVGDLNVSNANTLLEYVKCLTSSEIVKKPDVKNASGGYDPATDNSGELYEYRMAYSPYVLYYQWLKEFKFLPKK